METNPDNAVSVIDSSFSYASGAQPVYPHSSALTWKEVGPVMKVLQNNGIQAVALHSHALNDVPRLLYMHFWANDDAVKLARTLRRALDNTNSAKGQ